MPQLTQVLQLNRDADHAILERARGIPVDRWAAPRAPGKWSPAQVTDHVGVSTRVARDAVAMKPGLGSIPGFLRPIARTFFLTPALKNGFPKKGKGPPIFAPAHDPMPRPDLIARIDSEVTDFERETREMEKGGKTSFVHGFFGEVSLADYVMFNALHFDHHREQLPVKV